MNDPQILDLFWARNQDAIAQTDQHYGRKLRGLAFRILRNREDAQECVSDTYLKAWETIPPQRPNHFFAYLATLCRNFCLGRLDWNNAAKRRAEVVSLTEEMERCIPDESRGREWEGWELSRVLNAFLEDLPQESRVIFLRRYWFCDSVADIARRYGFSESKVKTRLHRTRLQLANCLKKEGIEV